MNNPKLIFIVAVVIILIFVGIIAIRPAPTVNQDSGVEVSSLAGSLTAQEHAFDFGTISMKKGEVTHNFAIKNSGSGPITITRLFTSCMCTVASMVRDGKKVGPFGMEGHGYIPKIKEVLGAGEEATIEVTFDPAAHGPSGVGSIQRAIYLESDGALALQLEIAANVTP